MLGLDSDSCKAPAPAPRRRRRRPRAGAGYSGRSEPTIEGVLPRSLLEEKNLSLIASGNSSHNDHTDFPYAQIVLHIQLCPEIKPNITYVKYIKIPFTFRDLIA